jgi:hypothetical protein
MSVREVLASMASASKNGSHASHKPTEVGGVKNSRNESKPLANIARFETSTPPHCGEGCGEPPHEVVSGSSETFPLLKRVHIWFTNGHHLLFADFGLFSHFHQCLKAFWQLHHVEGFFKSLADCGGLRRVGAWGGGIRSGIRDTTAARAKELRAGEFDLLD